MGRGSVGGDVEESTDRCQAGRRSWYVQPHSIGTGSHVHPGVWIMDVAAHPGEGETQEKASRDGKGAGWEWLAVDQRWKEGGEIQGVTRMGNHGQAATG